MNWIIALLLLVGIAGNSAAAVQSFTMNGIQFEVDESSGVILRIATAASGRIIDTPATNAGLLTLGYPINAFRPLQLEAKYSAAVLTKQSNEVIIAWEKLGPSRNVKLPEGVVSARVRIRPATDNQSVILSCHIDNHSQAQIYQVCFPDLQGVRAFAGEQQTLIGGQKVFAEPVVPEDRDSKYAMVLWKMLGQKREIELRGPAGGLTITQKTWALKRLPNLMSHRDEADPSWLRVLWRHKTPIDPGESWDSGEFWLTRTVTK